MKKCTFLLTILMLIASLGFSQNAPIDFETEGYGADWGWSTFENDVNPALEIVDNPDANGANASTSVAKFTALQSGQPWAGTETEHGADIGTFDLTIDNCIIKIMVYKTVISDVGIKLTKNDGWSLGEIKVSNTVVNEWEELTFDFSSQLESNYDQIVVFPDFNTEGRTQDNIVYFDNITFSASTSGGNEPTVGAPVPTHDAADVVSLFSDTYTDVTVDTWRTDWSEATLEDVAIDGNPAKKYSALDFVGIETTSTTVDASEKNHLHMDVWSPNFTQFSIKLVDFGADGAYDGGDDTEHQVDIATPAQGEWVSIDIPLSDFTNLGATEHLAQYILVGQPTGTTIVYIDNFYFYNESATSTSTITFNVTDGTDPIAGASIEIASQTLTTDDNGTAIIELEDGSYGYTITATDFETETGNVTVEGAEQTINVALTPVGIGTVSQNIAKVYPNPATDGINIAIEEFNSTLTLQIADLSGRVVYRTDMDATQTHIDISAFANGAYILMLNDNNKTVSKHLIIKK